MATKINFVKARQQTDNLLFEYLGRAKDGGFMYAFEEFPVGKTLEDIFGKGVSQVTPNDHPYSTNLDLYVQQKGNSYGRG